MRQESQLETIYPIIESLCADDYNELLKTMNLGQKDINKAHDALHKIIFRERSLNSTYVKNGKTNKGRQRYISKVSNQSFSDTDQSIVRYTKKSYEQWSEFIKCMLYGLSLRKIALEVGISTTTAFSWRHKVIKAMVNYQEVIKLSGEVQVDETYFLLNMKGPWKNKEMPRKPKKKGKPSIYRGISNEQVCVLVAIDSHDQILSKIIGQGSPTKDDIYQTLEGKIASGSLIITDSRAAYKKAAKEVGCDLIQIPSGKHIKGDYNLGMINNYHGELKTWFKKFNGVSTKHLDGYLAWFRFMKYLGYQHSFEKHTHVALKHIVSSLNSIRIKDISNNDFPIDIFKPYQHLS